MRIKYKDAYDYWTKPQCCQLSDFDAIFSYFSDPFGDFFSKQRQATNLAPFSAAIGDFWRLFEVKALSLLPLHNEHRVPARPLPRLNALTGSSVLVVKSKLRNRMSLQTLNSILYIRYGLKLSGDACFEHQLPDHDLKLFGTSAAYSFKVAPTAEPAVESLDQSDDDSLVLWAAGCEPWCEHNDRFSTVRACTGVIELRCYIFFYQCSELRV